MRALATPLRSADLAGHDHLVAAVRAAVVEYWRSGGRAHPPELQRVVDYWVRFHLIKGGIAALLLIVLGALAAMLWRTYLRADGLGTGSQAALASAGAAVPMLALLAVVMANIQGAMAPFSSLMPMLMEGPPDASLAGTLAQARQLLAGSHRTDGHTPPALDAMISDFAWYHAAMAGISAVAVVALLALSVMFWRREHGRRDGPGAGPAGPVQRLVLRRWQWAERSLDRHVTTRRGLDRRRPPGG